MKIPAPPWTPFACLLSLVLLMACRATPTPLPVPTATPTGTRIPSATRTPAPSPTAVTTATSIPASSICSPLTRHPLEQLPLLISWEFNPFPPDNHFGVDFGHWSLGEEESSLYDPVQALMDGRVAGFVIDRPPHGTMITLETPHTRLPPALIEALGIPPGNSVYHQYAHLADPSDLQIGQPVACGDLLNRVGLTGWTVAPHLHLETRWGPPGFTFTEMAYYSADATPAEMASYETWFVSGQYQPFDPMILFSLPQPGP
ncbi:MAG: hypothetical protein JXB85_18105 [Anaerolineales bacterium]|nr:hypothetical protein [Anaerolineales bacterium]